jgi:hypothetical protein
MERLTEEEQYLLQLWAHNICPNCGKTIPEGTRIGTGEKRKGGFCSLDCYAVYYGTELRQRLTQLAGKLRGQSKNGH